MVNQTELNKKIMRRIYCVFYVRKIFSVTAIKIYTAVLLIWGLFSNVSFMNVYKNTMEIGMGLERVSAFYKYAFMHTEFVVQASISAIAVFFLYLLFEKTRHLIYPHPHQSL